MVRRLLTCAALLVACEINPAFDPDAVVGTGSATGSGSAEDTGATTDTEIPGQPLPNPCPPWPAATGEIITVGPEQASELPNIVGSAPANSTVMIEPGVYPIDRELYVNEPGVTLRSSTGNPTDVIIDGQRLAASIVFTQFPDTTVTELTLRRPTNHVVHVAPVSEPSSAARAQIYRVVLEDPGFAALKMNINTGNLADDGVLACSTIRLTDAGRSELGESCESVGGVLGVGVFGWTIRDNTFEDLWCEAGLVAPAVAFIETSAHNVIERNTIRDCGRGIALGVHELFEPIRDYGEVPCGDGYFDHLGGEIHNNVVVSTGTAIAASEAGFYSGISLWNVCDATVVHNTVVSAIETFTSIEYRFDRTQALVVNNLVSDEIIDRDGAGVPVAGNLQQVDLAQFVDPLAGDVHLLSDSEAVDAGVALGEDAVLHDIDGDPRDDRPDVGADELP